MKKILLSLSVILSLFLISCKNNTVTPVSTPVPTATVCLSYGSAVNDNDSMWNGGDFGGNSFTATASVSVINLSVKEYNSVGSYAAALYTDASGKPGTLLAETGILPEATGWTTAAITPVSLTAGNTYWIVTIGQNYGILTTTSPPAGSQAGALRSISTWVTFGSTGFPADASVLTWLISANTVTKAYVSNCN